MGFISPIFIIMDNLFALLTTISFIVLCVAYFKPSIVRLKSKKQVILIFGGTTFIFFVLFGIVSPSPNNQLVAQSQSVQAPVKSIATTTTAITSQVPLTEKQKIENVALFAIDKVGSSWATIKNIEDTSALDYGVKDMPAGSKLVIIDIESGNLGGDSGTLILTGQLTSEIMHQIFQINPKFNEVLVRYYSKLVDQYGNTNDGMMMSYTMDRAIYSKINWSGFSDTQNDIHLCSFLKNQNSLWHATESNGVDQSESYVGCVLSINSLQEAENIIELGN
jgi:hypothetical protein